MSDGNRTNKAVPISAPSARALALVLCALGTLTAGCFGPPNLPAELDVVLPNDVRVTVQAGGGATNMADATWSAFRKPDPENGSNEDGANDAAPEPGPYGGLLNGGFLERPEPDTLMYRVQIDENGHAVEVLDNAFYVPEIFGENFIVDGQFHNAKTIGLSYAAASFGASRDDQFGLAIPVDVRFLGLPVGTAMVFAWGTRTGDRLDGTFGYNANLNPIPELLLGSGGDKYPFYATRDP